MGSKQCGFNFLNISGTGDCEFTHHDAGVVYLYVYFLCMGGMTCLCAHHPFHFFSRFHAGPHPTHINLSVIIL